MITFGTKTIRFFPTDCVLAIQKHHKESASIALTSLVRSKRALSVLRGGRQAQFYTRSRTGANGGGERQQKGPANAGAGPFLTTSALGKWRWVSKRSRDHNLAGVAFSPAENVKASVGG
jgi:hypothetical protein